MYTRYWISELCFYLLVALAVVGCGTLLRATTGLSPALIITLAMCIVYAIHYTGERAVRGLP